MLVHGCFWNGCPDHCHAPKANSRWWALKLQSVVARDEDTLRMLHAADWLPLVVWEDAHMADAARRILALDPSPRQAVRDARR